MIPTAKLVLLLNAVAALAAPIQRREVPQEHSHEKYLSSVRASLQLDNPDGILDPVFGLLGNAAAAQGAGNIADPDCLHLATADRAFTNAKAAGDVQGQVDALIFAALERNTGAVGLKSVLCTSITAVNPEIQAISQHQDPASEDAAAINKAITLELARQIAGVGGDPLQALESGTFAPGQIGDPTARGNSCNDANDPVGCIFTQNLLVPDASEAEIAEAVAGVQAGGAGGAAGEAAATETAVVTATATATGAAGATDTCPPAVTVTVTVDAAGATATPTATATATPVQVAQPEATVGAGAGAEEGDGGAGAVGGALDLGACTNPSIEFGPGFDGRREDSFRPVNGAEFNHGSAQNPKIITDFICDRLQDQCKAPAATVQVCRDASTAAGVIGKVGAAADEFNARLGFQSNFGAGGAAEGNVEAGAGAGAGSGGNAGSGANVDNGAASGSGQVVEQPVAAAGNLQTFNGALGGVTAPVVTDNGQQNKNFCVADNACFDNLINALVRSCDVQNNKCADASNAAGQNKQFSVGNCNQQQAQCITNARAIATRRV